MDYDRNDINNRVIFPLKNSVFSSKCAPIFILDITICNSLLFIYNSMLRILNILKLSLHRHI